MILIDTSAWVDFFRAEETGATAEVRTRLDSDFDQVAMCEPIAMELLAGASNEVALGQIERLLNGLGSLSLDTAVDFRMAADLYRAARRAGNTVRSLVDCLIAAISLRHDATLLHKDVDYEVLARVSRLRQVSLR